MSEMTLPSRHRIRNSNPGGLGPSTLPLGHGGLAWTETCTESLKKDIVQFHILRCIISPWRKYPFFHQTNHHVNHR